MDTIGAAAAAVTGARHLRAARNGQDAAAVWRGDGAAAVVVCDGCSSGASSEVGARLGAKLVLGALASRIAAGEAITSADTWAAVRLDVVRALGRLCDRVGGNREDFVRQHLLFTIVAAAATRDEAAIWTLGDGAYSIDGERYVVGPFEDNSPPYLGYDLIGFVLPPRLRTAAGSAAIVVATDGAAELDLARFAERRFLDHPDALRRELAVLARGTESIDWDERRVVRTPAALQDDGAIGVILR